MRSSFHSDGSRRRVGTFLGGCAGTLLCTGLLAGSALGAQTGAEQESPSGSNPRITTRPGDALNSTPGVDPKMREHMEQRRNEDRQKQLVADTDKLLLLAQELKEEVGKSNKDQLSLTVLKKSEQIDKLAKSVKDRMRGY